MALVIDVIYSYLCILVLFFIRVYVFASFLPNVNGF